jgi:prepilin-type N-terminal cleavage/methylation domain-containing protein
MHTQCILFPTTRKAFTLVEMMVVLVIISILASLSLAGLNVGRHRAKIDKTASTIRKIDAVVQEMYSDYLTRSVLDDDLPRLMTFEMPDQWDDVQLSDTLGSLPRSLQTGAIRRYSRIATSASVRTQLGDKLTNAECLYLCVARSGYEPDAIEQFRADEVGDLDSDGAKEFLDAWGKPIFFIRWAPGYSAAGAPGYLSPIQMPAAPTASIRDKIESLVPLIYSAGPDEASNDTLTGPDGYALQRPRRRGAPNTNPYDPILEFPDAGKPRTDVTDLNAYKDNITNHQLMTR